MTQARGQTNIKTIMKSSVTGTETMQHHPIKSETFLPASKTTIKEKSS
jgi:hypothetical protein